MFCNVKVILSIFVKLINYEGMMKFCVPARLPRINYNNCTRYVFFYLLSSQKLTNVNATIIGFKLLS